MVKFDSTMKFYVLLAIIAIALIMVYPYTTEIGQFVRGSLDPGVKKVIGIEPQKIKPGPIIPPQPILPDIGILDALFEKNPVSYDSYTNIVGYRVTLVLSNIGEGAINQDIDVVVYDNTYNKEIFTGTFTPMPYDSANIIKFDWLDPEVGSHEMLIMVDYNEQITETDETNNELNKIFVVTQDYYEEAKVELSWNKLNVWDKLHEVRPSYSSEDFSMTLSSGTFQTTTGSSYEYTQGIEFGLDSPQLVYGIAPGDIDAGIHLKFKQNYNAYEYSLYFPVGIGLSSITSTVDLQAMFVGTNINMLSRDFAITDCTWDNVDDEIEDITLLGGKDVGTIATGEDKVIGDYTVHLDAVIEEIGGQYSAIGNVNGEAFSLAAGSTHTLSDGTVIAAIKVWQGKTGEVDYAKIAVDADKIKLSASGTVIKGTAILSNYNSQFVQGGNLLTAIRIKNIPTADVWLDWDESYYDELFGILQIDYNIPRAAQRASYQIKFEPDNQSLILYYMRKNMEQTKLPILYYDGTIEWSIDGANRDMIFDESKAISALDKDYFIVNSGTSHIVSHILQFISMTNTTPTLFELTFRDEAGNSIVSNAVLSTGNDGELVVGGRAFSYNIINTLPTVKTIEMDLNADGDINDDTSGQIIIDHIVGKERTFLMPAGLEYGKLLLCDSGDVMIFDTANYTCSTPSFILLQDLDENGRMDTLFMGAEWDATHNMLYIYPQLQSSDPNYSNILIPGYATIYKGMTSYGTSTKTQTPSLGGIAAINYYGETPYEDHAYLRAKLS